MSLHVLDSMEDFKSAFHRHRLRNECSSMTQVNETKLYTEKYS